MTQRLSYGQASLAAASNSSSVRWVWAKVPGVASIFVVDADAWVYPLVYDLAQPQWDWLDAQLARVDRSETPWLLLVPHRAMYCTKTTDPECNSEAESLRYGLLDTFFGLEELIVKYGVDMVFAGQQVHPKHSHPHVISNSANISNSLTNRRASGDHISPPLLSTHHYEATWPVVKGVTQQTNYVDPRAAIHVQSGIAGTGPGGDPFDVPQEPWERFRDMSFSPSYGRITFHNATHLSYWQLFAQNRSVLDSMVVVQRNHGPFAN